MAGYIIKDTSPLRDLNRIIDETVKLYNYPSGAETNILSKRERLKAVVPYMALIQVAKIFGSFIVITLSITVISMIMYYGLKIGGEFVQSLSIYMLIAFFIIVAIELVLLVIGGIMEQAAWSDDIHMIFVAGCETRVLNNGQIVILHRNDNLGIQIFSTLDSKSENRTPIGVDWIFFIDNVKSVKRDENSLTCCASGIRRYLHYPYSPDEPSDIYASYYFYKEKYISYQSCMWTSSIKGYARLENELKNARRSSSYL